MSTDETQPLPGDPAPPSAGSSRERRLDEAIAAYLASIGSSSSPDPRPWLERYPDLSDELRLFFADHGRMENLARPVRAATAAGLPVGSRVHYVGDYELLRELGRGGMGVVYEARQVSLNRIVAVKMILAGELATAAEVERFYAEARTAATLQHPNIVALHEVGQHEGRHYFSMDYVAGKSLAEMVQSQPLTPQRAATYVKAIAEAIHFAHQQGVLHRDLKPSNVLIDPFDQPKVTDFGLAKRVMGDDPRTATGAVLGTPSYMPPEQASSDRGQVGPASDVYSLGAMLYELVTGRPPFRAATLLETLIQVREAEPAPPRTLNPAVNRDLETIILKCLAKEIAGRYGSAQNLADDLGRFLRDEPIQAHRPSPLERMLRWGHRHRRTVATVAASVLAALVALQAGVIYRSLGQGSVGLGTNDPDLSAQIFDEREESVTAPLRVPTTSAVTLPAGKYQLRLSSPGLPTETWPLDIQARTSRGYDVRLRSQLLWPPLESTPGEVCFLLPEKDRTDLLLIAPAAKRLRRIHGASRQPLWPRDLVFDQAAVPPGDREAEWHKRTDPFDLDTWEKKRARWHARIVQPAPDLDGDGTNDIVLTFPEVGLVCAISGDHGSFLWIHGTSSTLYYLAGTPGSVDADGDSNADVVACFHNEAQAEVQALSGTTGHPLWTYPIDKAIWQGDLTVNRSQQSHRWTLVPQAVQVRGESAVVFAAGTKIIALGARTGKELWPPQDIPLHLFRTPQLADFDGDGAADLLLFGQAAGLEMREDLHDEPTQLAVFSLATTKLLWRAPLPTTELRANWDDLELGQHPWARELPQVLDIDGDGAAEILACIGTVYYNAGQPPWSGIAALDGATGKERWRRRLTSPVHGRGHYSDQEIAHFLVGPDISGDGHREVFVPWVAFDDQREATMLHVACLSGRDGRPLWIQKSASQAGDPLSAPFLGATGDDGWPLLVVTLGRSDRPLQTATMHALRDGQLCEVLIEMKDLTAADLNGDGDSELVYAVQPQAAPRILAVAGRTAETWRRLGGLRPAADFDGDKQSDFVDDNRTGDIAAHSGRNGEELWSVRDGFWHQGSAIAPPLPWGDFNGDGVADLIGVTGEVESLGGGPVRNTISARSGRDGHLLWTSNDFSASYGSLPHLGWHDLDGDQRAEVLLINRPGQGWVSELELVVLAGTNGRHRWETKISDVHLGRPPDLSGSRDLNGDGAADLVLWVPQADSQPGNGNESLRAYSGKDGQVLWTVMTGQAERFIPLRTPVIDDMDRDGAPDVLAMRTSYNARRQELVLLNGQSGDVRWSWQSEVLDSYVLPPLVAELEPGQKSILVQTPANSEWLVTILGADGKVRRQIPMQPESRWMAIDLTGDGAQEILTQVSSALQVLQGDDLHGLWERKLPVRVLEALPAEKGKPAMVVLAGTGEVLGLDGSTGLPRWRCDLGPNYEPNTLVHVQANHDLAPGGQMPPRVVFHEPDSWATICRQAVTIGKDGQPLSSPASPVTPTLAADLMLQRPLPWDLNSSFQQMVAPLAGWNEMTRTYFASGPIQPRVVFSPGFAFFVLMVIPWILWRCHRRELARIREIAALYLLLVGSPYLVWLLGGLIVDSVLWLLLFPIVVGLTGILSIPYLCFALRLARSLERRQWRQTAFLIVGSLALAAALAALMLRLDAAIKLPDERYQWHGWYLIWFQTAYALGLMLLLVAIVQWSTKWLSRLRTTFTRRRN